MTREEVIKLLALIRSTVYLGNRKFFNALEFAISYLRQPEPQWIPCSVRLPEPKEQVLVYQTYTRFHEITIGWRTERKFWEWIDYPLDLKPYSPTSFGAICPGNEYVKAWMPLPEPYREDGNEQ